MKTQKIRKNLTMKLLHKRDRNAMTMNEHMRELRRRSFIVVAFLIAIFVITYTYSNAILDILTSLGKDLGYIFVYISPQEVLLQQLRISFTLATLLTLPLLVYQVIAYVAPVYSDSKHFKLKALTLGLLMMILLVIGILFAYKVILPFTYRFLYSISAVAGIESCVSIKEYVSLFLTICICLGIVFELPLVCIMLTHMGILSATTLKRGSKVMVVLAFLVGAIITPPDVISQVIVALPIIALYQLSILICSVIDAKRNKDSE